MALTLGQAAKAAGIAKSTLAKAVENGRVSAKRANADGTGAYQIEPSELFRVYPPKQSEDSLENQKLPPEVSDATVELQHKNELLELEIKHLREQLNTAQIDKDHWRVSAQGLLEDKRPRQTVSERLAALFGRAKL